MTRSYFNTMERWTHTLPLNFQQIEMFCIYYFCSGFLLIVNWIRFQSFANNLIKFNCSTIWNSKLKWKCSNHWMFGRSLCRLRSTRKSYDSIKQSLCNENWFVWDFHNRTIEIMFALNDQNNENNIISKMKLHFILFLLNC